MKIAFFSIILNNHQANVADELWELTGHSYCFVELLNMSGDHRKGDTRDYSSCPYLLQAWRNDEARRKAMDIALTADVAFFGSVESYPYLCARVKKGLLSFDFGERWMKRGWLNMLSPRIMKMFLCYKFGGWDKKLVYKLCSGAYVAGDQYKLNTYVNRCYKWGYFTKVDTSYNIHDVEACSNVSTSVITPLMWCSRYLKWKHPELPILMAKKLKDLGYSFKLDMYGEGEYKSKTLQLAKELGVSDIISFYGNYPNNELLEKMKTYEIFLLTSDQNEGWGAVINESMSCGCAVVTSKVVGAAPYLIEDRTTGSLFSGPSTRSGFSKTGLKVDQSSLDSLVQCVKSLLENKHQLKQIRKNALRTMQETWSPKNAAINLLQLVDDIRSGRESSIETGPCSKAEPILEINNYVYESYST